MVLLELLDEVACLRMWQIQNLLQALVNCTRKSLLPADARDTEARGEWEKEIRDLEMKGVR